VVFYGFISSVKTQLGRDHAAAAPSCAWLC